VPAFFDTQKERWVAIPGDPPCPVKLEQFIRHVEKFGPECVVETAIELGLHQRDLLRLRVECDAFEARREWVGKRRRRLAEDTEVMVRYLRAEGFVIGVIAEKLGISDAHVKRCLRLDQRVPDSQKNGSKPTIHAAEMVLNAEPGLSLV
jgi:hypothetical protein